MYESSHLQARRGCRSCATAAICRASPPSPAPSKHCRSLPSRQTWGSIHSIKPQSCLCLVRAAGPFQHFRYFVKKHRTNLFLPKFGCVKWKFLHVFNSSVLLQYLLFVWVFFKKSIPSCNGNRKGFSIFNRLTLKELSWNQINSVNLSVLWGSCWESETKSSGETGCRNETGESPCVAQMQYMQTQCKDKFPGCWLSDLNESLIPIAPGNCWKQRWRLAQNRKLVVVRSVCKCNCYFSQSRLSQLGGALKELNLLQN